MKYTVYSDGAARGNPGPAGAGYAVFDESRSLVHSQAIPLGRTTNNVAEYTAALEAARFVKTLKPDAVDFLMDSELIVRQLSGVYKVKSPNLIPLYKELSEILSCMNSTCRHIPREQNKLADRLANEGADKVKENS